ncbi:TPA: cytoplasmic protein [Salmonella enterica]|uniref:Cytoplasmic protein n=1 Tax=Salmonella enterica TaxID=28901 RepID=A0A754BDA2_SALER|nr:cytoplasmic protein [Salmonella enterica]ECU9164086.1 cytoplasmic protein [Salmonella enterica subsp. enterica serovar Newport str. CFSAN000599]EDU1197022.1 cytoplasmic protein [Salmonella enterica subsp. enterica serovar Heidelberg str. CFSAN000576]HAF8581150.1 cytoplasmic protein [Salmonella enterica]
MIIAESVLLGALRRGGCVRTFWRRPARLSGTPVPEFPDGFVLETPGESGDTPLSHVDFAVARKWLVRSEDWSQIAGATEFGGTVWCLAQEYHVTADHPVLGDGDQDEA